LLNAKPAAIRAYLKGTYWVPEPDLSITRNPKNPVQK